MGFVEQWNLIILSIVLILIRFKDYMKRDYYMIRHNSKTKKEEDLDNRG